MNQFSNLIAFFMPSKEVCSDRESRRKLRLSILFGIITEVVMILYSIVNWFVGNIISATGNSIAAFLIFLVLFQTKKKGKVVLAGNSFLFCALLSINAGIFSSGAGLSPSLNSLLILPIAASLAIHVRSGVVWGVLVSLNAAAIVLYSYGHPPTHVFDAKHYGKLLFIMTTVVFLSLFFSSRFQKMKDDAMAMVEERNKTIRRIIENVRSGFLVVSRDFTVELGHSLSCHQLFNRDSVSGENFAELLSDDSRIQEHLKCVWEQVFFDFLPIEVSMSQGPSSFRVNNRYLGVSGSPLRELNGKVSGILFTINDITDQIAAEESNLRNAKLIFVLKHKETFRGFVADTTHLLSDIRVHVKNKETDEALKLLHALKGSASSFGLIPVSKLIHNIEDKGTVEEADVETLVASFHDFLETCRKTTDIDFTEKNNETREVTRNELRKLLTSVEGNSSLAETKLLVERWVESHDQVKVWHHYRHFTALVESIGRDCRKPVQLTFAGENVSIDADQLQPLATHFASAFRNSVFHGIEDPWERDGKPAAGQITFRTMKRDSWLHIDIIDDGRGVDADRVRERLMILNIVSQESLATLSPHEVIQMVFEPQFTTEEQAKEVAGRGLGLSALRDVVRSMGGKVELFSEKGNGSTLSISVPLLRMQSQKLSA